MSEMIDHKPSRYLHFNHGKIFPIMIRYDQIGTWEREGRTSQISHKQIPYVPIKWKKKSIYIFCSVFTINHYKWCEAEVFDERIYKWQHIFCQSACLKLSKKTTFFKVEYGVKQAAISRGLKIQTLEKITMVKLWILGQWPKTDQF